MCYGLVRLMHVIRVKRHIPFPHRIFLRSVMPVKRVIHVIHVINHTPFPTIIRVVSVMYVMYLIHVINVMSPTSVLNNLCIRSFGSILLLNVIQFMSPTNEPNPFYDHY